MRRVARKAEAHLGDQNDTALYLDETSFVKKGNVPMGGNASIAAAWPTMKCATGRAGTFT